MAELGRLRWLDVDDVDGISGFSGPKYTIGVVADSSMVKSMD